MAKFHDLYKAVQACDCARLRHLVGGGIDVNCRDSRRRTVLHHAAEQFWGAGMDVIQTLVELGADLNAADLTRITPLHYLLMTTCTMKDFNSEKPFICSTEQPDIVVTETHESQDVSAVEFLVRLGADVNAQFELGVTSLHRAIQQNNKRGIETLLRLGVDVNAYKWINCTAVHLLLDPTAITLLPALVALGADVNSSYTALQPLLEAVESGRMDLIKMLVQHGADVNNFRMDNNTPILVTTDKMLPRVVRILAQLGADLDVKQYISNIVNEIVITGRVDILEYLVKHGAKILNGSNRITALAIAIDNNNYEMVDCLVRGGADVNVWYDEGITPFVTAMRLGDIDMVRALAKLATYPIYKSFLSENRTALHAASKKDIKTMKLLLKYGGDVNLKYNEQVLPVHDAVAQGNGEMLKVLDELGANLNSGKIEGVSLLHHLTAYTSQGQMAMIKLLVESGLDLNQCHNAFVTPLHDAVRLGDANMVQILGEMKADMNAKTEGKTPIFAAIEAHRTDIVRYFAKKGANVNSSTSDVTPLHDAVKQGNVDMVHVLNNSGADTKCAKIVYTPLCQAIDIGNNELVKCLLERGADINAKVSLGISPLHLAVEKSDLGMISTLAYPDDKPVMRDQSTPLQFSVAHNYSDITETLLKCGADMNCKQAINMTPLDVALNQGKWACAQLLMSRGVGAYRDTTGSSPLHYACRLGHIDQARLLIIEGSDVNKLDYFRRKPLECLPLANTADYHVLQETVTTKKLKAQVPTSLVSISQCQNMTTSLHTPGIGDVHCISSLSATEISWKVNKLLSSIIQQCKTFSDGKFKPIGSDAEGTRVSLPNEMDLLFRVQLDKDEERKMVDLGNGYAKYHFHRTDTIRIQQEKKSIGMHVVPNEEYGSAEFHSYFIEQVMDEVFSKNVSDEKVSINPTGSTGITDTNRKACSPLRLKWNDGMSSFIIPVDIVPCLHIDNWPEGATTRTWLMDEQELYSRGYVLVPKPPHIKSDLAKKCTEEDLHTLWKISFPHLETEHMQRLEQRVKDVYITAKCLRNPDVCRIMVIDDGSLPRTVSKYVTSYQLKMCFFKNVEYFLQHDDLCLEEMVCKVYDDLVLGLSKNFIPLFFLPKVSALSGINLNVPKCLKVAKIMARFVRALYLRDSLGDITDDGDDMVMTVYQRNPGSVYRVYDISNEEV